MGNALVSETNRSAAEKKRLKYALPWKSNTKGYVPEHLRLVEEVSKSNKINWRTDNHYTEKMHAAYNSSLLLPEEHSLSDKIPTLYKESSSEDITDTTIDSTSTSKTKFRWSSGRRFHNAQNIQYPLPTDKEELDRLRVEYYIFRWVFGGHIIAPVKGRLQEGGRALHVNCGPGIWSGHPVIDLALDYPYSNFTTIDICNLLPEEDIQHADGEMIRNILATKSADTSQRSSVMSGISSKDLKYSVESSRNSNLSHLLNFALKTPAASISDIPFHSTNKARSAPTSFNSTTSIDTMEEYLPQHQQEVHKYSPYFDTSLSTNEEIQQRSCPHPFSYHKSHHPTPVSALDLSLPLNDNRPKQFLNNLFFHPLNIRHQPVPFMDNTFDYIQQDLVSLAYSEKDWEKVLSELVRVTKPGGYIQLIEMDFFTHGAGTKYNAWQDQLLRSNRNRHNINGRTALTLKEKLKNAGLTKIETKFVSIPIGSWGLDIGLLWKENYKSFMRAATPVLVELSEKPIDEFYKEWKEVFDELSEFRAFNNVHVAWGVKPN